ncbi:hypothetical protein JCM19236_6513 [Vibrio sp. JCM 19236]|nr:hypothetical protein JCM19236_6513 [Vibrio sp. JCM 19236]
MFNGSLYHLHGMEHFGVHRKRQPSVIQTPLFVTEYAIAFVCHCVLVTPKVD